MPAIKKYENLTVIELKDWQVVTVTQTVEQVAQLLNGTDFVLLGDLGVNKYEVRKFYKFSPDDIEVYILSNPDKKVRGRMQEIYDERKKANLRTAGIEHLCEIYNNRYED